MIYLLDTNICIYILRKQPTEVLQHFQQVSIGNIGVSCITVSELAFGVSKSRWSERNKAALEQFLMSLTIYPFDYHAAFIYGTLRTDLERKGTPISNPDMLIAAHALSQNLILVTNNEREFSRILNLRVENWINIPEE